jgi:hypothetical protein
MRDPSVSKLLWVNGYRFEAAVMAELFDAASRAFGDATGADKQAEIERVNRALHPDR